MGLDFSFVIVLRGFLDGATCGSVALLGESAGSGTAWHQEHMSSISVEFDRIVVDCALGEETGARSYSMLSAYTAHVDWIGQASHAGRVGVHSVLPSSMRAWFHRPGTSLRWFGATCSTSIRAMYHRRSFVLFERGSTYRPVCRLSTRATFPSRIGTACPNTMEEIAPAV